MRVLTLLLISVLGTASAQEPIRGFADHAVDAQRAIETRYDSALSVEDMDGWMRRLTASPHHAGSAANRENAKFLSELMESWGYDVTIDEYDILLPTPKIRELELTAPNFFTATLTEMPVEGDPSTLQYEDLLAPYNSFSIGGEVESELVFVNYGVPADYDMLERYGIDVEGKIVIVKYGQSWRGIKPKLAAEKGAIGTIMYSDPADDGYAVGDVYPDGAFKNETAVQRGSVMDMPLYPGDVLTPGVGATGNVERLEIDNTPTLTKIPVLPISYRDALPLLSAIGGTVVPEAWRGALPITYHLGPGPARVRMKLEFNWDRITIYNVIARLEGSEYPDEWVIRGNHYDAWNHGAADPISGLVAMLAEAKAVAVLADAGQRPARTIIYAAWDSEEQGLIGSTEWVEHHAADLDRHAVAYINTDGNSRGFLNVGGSHTLERFFNQIARDVFDPQTDVSLADRLRARMRTGEDELERQEAQEREDLRIAALGSGSDYSPFLQHLGIASAHLSFSGEGPGGSYHTLYDTYEHYTTWRDPGLVYSDVLAQVAGRATLRLANARVLPFEFTGFSDNIEMYITELEELVIDTRTETERTNALIEDGEYDVALDPTQPFGPPKAESPVPHFNFAPLNNSLERLQNAATSYEKALENGEVREDDLAELNALLYSSERLLTREEGLAGRPWYRHYIYAPGFYTGYGVKTIPGVRESIEQRSYEVVDPQIELAASVIDAMAERIETAAGYFEY
ncbi:MAG: M28 family peptidase [Gammaproteobacteria bacterium]|nr:M28 family peptidase [Gammaproteobacteria bacterium]